MGVYFRPPLKRYHRSLLLVLLLTATGSLLHAQRPDGPRPEMKGRVIGRVFDENSEPLPFSSVALVGARDSIITGTIGKANGDFKLDAVPAGRFTVRISSMGYEDLDVAVVMTPAKPEQDLGDLRMKVSQHVLKEAEVVGEASKVNLRVDRRVYNVEKDLSVRGGTGEDVMKNVPGLGVDVDGNVTLRNASPRILVDGRPTTLTLDMIPADDIERVEVITTPSAAFEANTTGGIVNVVLKKSDRPGYSGQLQAGAGTNGRANTSGNLNVKEDPFTFTFSGNYNMSDVTTRSETDRIDRSDGQDIGSFLQDGENDSQRRMRGARAGIDWNVTNRNTLSGSFSFHRRGYEQLDDQTFANSDALGSVTTYGTQVNEQENDGGETRAQLGFRRKSPKEGREWTADLTWNRSDRGSTSYFTTTTLGDTPDGRSRVQHNEGSTLGDQLTFQLDAQHPVNDANKIDFGARSSWRIEESVLDSWVTDTAGVARYDSVLSNRYDVTDIVNALYGNWSRKLTDRWSLMAGVRVEMTDLVAELPSKGERYTYRYPDGTNDLEKVFFPSVYLSRKWEGLREFQINFSRKINRPNFWQVMPFVMFSDSRSFRIGNPALGPELTWIGEVNHLLPIGSPKNNWLISAFTKYTTGVITSYVYPKPDEPEVLVSTFVNGDDSWTYGFDNTLKLEPRKGMQLTIGAIAQYVEVGLSSINARNSGWTFNGKVNASQRFGAKWTAQVNGEYEGERPVPQGVSLPQYGLDLSVNHEPNKRWSFTFGLNDAFDTRRWGNVYDTETVYQESYRRRDSRHARFTLTWKFGEQNMSLFRRRGGQRREPGADGGEGGEM